MHSCCRLVVVGVIVARNEIRGRSGSSNAEQRRESGGHFGAKSALDYLIGEKLVTLAHEAERQPEFAKELPRFLAAIWQVFNQYGLAGYVASQKPATRKQLRRLLYTN